jgi:hypothetical protein
VKSRAGVATKAKILHHGSLYPAELNILAASGQLLSISWKLNNLFCFTAIGTSSSFQKFQTGVSSVAVNGRVYHRMLDITQPHHSMHWFLYDAELARKAAETTYKVPIPVVCPVKSILDSVNPYVYHLHCFFNYAEDCTISIELSDPPVGQDFAAIVHANNSTEDHPQHILI